MEPLTQMEAAEKLGLAQSTLSTWLRKGVVEMGDDYERERGRPTPIGPKQMREFRTVRNLRAAGLSMQAIRRAGEYLRSMGFNPYSTGHFAVIEGGELVRVADSGEAMKLLQEPGQMQLVSLAPETPDAD